MGILLRSSFGGELTVTVLDVLSGRPLSGAKVELRKRVIEIDAGGEQHLLALDAGGIVAASATGIDGKATVTSEENGLFAVEISAEDYLSQIHAMMWMGEEEGASLTIDLVAAELTEEEEEMLLERQEVMREPVEQGPAIMPRGELQAFAVTVPDEVRVQDLNGFTGMVNLDEFIGGVVTREMNDGFPREALRAQAVASRSFALHRLRTRGFANGGQAHNPTLGTLSRAAAIFTSKQVLLHNGAIAQAFFSARCNGDFTLDSEDGPTLDRCFPGGLTTTVVPYCRSRPCSGHINCSQTTELCCEVTVNNKVNYIYGHGVGMCQRGAQQFASRDGWTYQRILTNFYTNITLHKGTNGLQLTIVSDATANGSPGSVLLEVRSGQPNTIFDIERTSALLNPSWSSLAAERGLSTGVSAVTQVKPQGSASGAIYFRAVLRE